jgi:hypothetical protein
MAPIALPRIQQPRTFIGSEESTPRNKTLQKVAIFSGLLGLGLMFIHFWIGAGVAALSAYAFRYLSKIDSAMSEGGYRLVEAANQGNHFKVNLYLVLGANPNVRPEYSPLANAAAHGHAAIIKDLLVAGANPDILTHHHETPLHHAVHAHQDKAVAVLLQHGADPTIRSRNIDPAGTPYDAALRNQQMYQREGEDHSVWPDERTREQRKIASDRIVELLRPYFPG